MSREPDLLLNDMLLACNKVEDYIHGLDRDSFEEDSRTVDAVIRNLEIMGEAVKGLPERLVIDYPSIDWRGIAGLRDVVTHAYFGIDMDIIWDIAKNKVPDLRRTVEDILNDRQRGP